MVGCWLSWRANTCLGNPHFHFVGVDAQAATIVVVVIVPRSLLSTVSIKTAV